MVSRHPKGYESNRINESDISNFIVWSDYKMVLKTCEQQRKLLKESGNSLYKSGGKQEIKVIPRIFKSGKFINEDWKEFEDWVLENVPEDMKLRHNYFKKIDPDWYAKFGDYQI